MTKLSYIKGNEYIAECFISDEFVEKLEKHELKEKFEKEFVDWMEKYIFMAGYTGAKK